MNEQLDDASVGASKAKHASPSFWASVFITAGVCAFLSALMSMIGEQFGSTDIELYARGLCFLTTPLCALAACVYLSIAGKDKGNFNVRVLAWVALGIAGGMVIAVMFFILLFALFPSEF